MTHAIIEKIDTVFAQFDNFIGFPKDLTGIHNFDTPGSKTHETMDRLKRSF